MEDLKHIWQPIEAFTLTNRLFLVELEQPVNELKLDTAWDKVLGDGRIVFEFNKGEAKNFKVIGSVKQCMENPELLNDVLETIPKYQEIYEIPKNDPEGWEKVPFIDTSGRGYKQMGRDFMYRKKIGELYINYGIPNDVMEYFPLNSPVDSFITVTRRAGLFVQGKDFLILKDLKYVAPVEEN